MSTKKPEDIAKSTTRAGYVIPHQGQGDGLPPASIQRAGYPIAPTPAQGQQQPAAGDPGRLVTGAIKATPIEIEYIQESDFGAVRENPLPMFEIWTRNRIYMVDSTMKCVAVVSRETAQPDPHHTLLGTRLTGGERRSKSSGAVEIYFPLPMPGTEAVFRNENKRNGQYGHTSTIERVVLKMHKVRVGTVETQNSWDEITGRFMVRGG